MITVYYCAVKVTQATKLSMGFYRGYSTWFMDVYGGIVITNVNNGFGGPSLLSQVGLQVVKVASVYAGYVYS